MKIRSVKNVVVAKSGDGNPRNDTASLTRLKSGRLMVVWHRYHDSSEGGSDFGSCSIYSKTSENEGLTWGNERQIVPLCPGDLNVQAPALCYLPNDELLLICMRAHARDSSTMELFRSNDDGETFSHGAYIWQRSNGQWLQGGASCLLRLKSGRLLLPLLNGFYLFKKQLSFAGIS
jgi:sialidase-1